MSRQVQRMDETPRQFFDELKLAILRRRVGQIALAVVLAQECIRFLNALIWYLVIPLLENALEGHTESLLFQTRRPFPWINLAGSVLELLAAIIFLFYANRWIYGRNRPRPQPAEEFPTLEQEKTVSAEGYEPIVPRIFSAPEAPIHKETARTDQNESPRRSEGLDFG